MIFSFYNVLQKSQFIIHKLKTLNCRLLSDYKYVKIVFFFYNLNNKLSIFFFVLYNLVSVIYW